MSSSKKLKKSGSRKRVKVEEVEEVMKVDRRGRMKLTMQPVKKDLPTLKTPLPHKVKLTARKTLSPKAGGSKHSFTKPRLSKVCDVVDIQD